MNRNSKKHTIVRSAIKVINQQGVERLTLDAVAQEAGLTKGGLLYHFRTKKQLIQAMMEMYLDTLEQSMNALELENQYPTTFLQRFVKADQETTHEDKLLILAILATADAGFPMDLGYKKQESWISTIQAEAKDPEAALILFFAIEGLRLLDMFQLLPSDSVIDRTRRRILNEARCN